VPSGLAQHERIADPRADVAYDSARIDHAGDCHPELHFLVSDGMSSDDHDAGLARLLGGAAQNLGQHLARQSCLRPAYDVQRGARRPAHRIDVGERVGGGNLFRR